MEAKQIRDLMEAYTSVYTQSEEQEVLSEDLQQTVGKALDVAAKNPVVKAIGKVIAPVGKGRGTVTKAEQDAKIKQNLNQDVDLFDLVKGHLMSEGYADTEEAALAIMANMSEEWKQSIVDEENHPVYGRGGEQRRTQTPRQIGVKGAPHNIPKGGTTISGRDPEGKRLFTGNQDRGKGNKARRRAGKEVEDTRG
jgi:hypothetical protein